MRTIQNIMSNNNVVQRAIIRLNINLFNFYVLSLELKRVLDEITLTDSYVMYCTNSKMPNALNVYFIFSSGTLLNCFNYSAYILK